MEIRAQLYAICNTREIIESTARWAALEIAKWAGCGGLSLILHLETRLPGYTGEFRFLSDSRSGHRFTLASPADSLRYPLSATAEYSRSSYD
ncbi:hypothetical protein HAX54_018502 [Datura stramonium]|uniref:Uncharacterized protein n=1 Tax=Datura stramonium TaxID=4076 RepID=A0ABS8UMP2_DATST|nr:hypothetical protein [Datura stramonium]